MALVQISFAPYPEELFKFHGNKHKTAYRVAYSIFLIVLDCSAVGFLLFGGNLSLLVQFSATSLGKYKCNMILLCFKVWLFCVFFFFWCTNVLNFGVHSIMSEQIGLLNLAVLFFIARI